MEPLAEAPASAPTPPRLTIGLVGLLAIAAAFAAAVLRVITARHLGAAWHSGDVNRFYRLSQASGRPYVDYSVEYPPLTLALFKVIAAVTFGRQQFGEVLVTLNLFADIGIAMVLGWAWGRRAAIFYLVAAVSLSHLLDARVDAISTLLATFGVASWYRRRPASAGTAIGMAALVKLWPTPLALLGLARGQGREGRRYTLLAILIGGSATAVWLATGGTRGVAEVLTYRHARGWEIETLPGLVLLAIHGGGAAMRGGAYRIGSIAVVWRLLLWATSIPIAAWCVARGARVGRVGAAWIGSVGALMVLSSLLSPQFLVWLMPGAAIAWVEDDRALALGVAVCAALTGIEMHHFHLLVDARPTWIALVGARDVLLAGSVVLAVRTLAAREPGTSRVASPLTDPSVLVVMPTYDERENIELVLQQIVRAAPRAHVLVVDDNSPDGTGAVVTGLAARDPQLHLLAREAKGGLGTAYRDGFAWGLARGFDLFVEIDADLSHDPADLPRLIAAATAGADLAIGSRYVKGGRVEGWPRRRELLSRSANLYARLLLDIPVRDATAGFRAFRAWVVADPSVSGITAAGYGFQILTTHATDRLGGTIAEVPITFKDRVRGRSKMDGRVMVEAAVLVATTAASDWVRPRPSAGPAELAQV